MIMTYDFVNIAKQNRSFRSQIDNAISSNFDSEIYTNMHRLIFSSESQTIIITAKSDTSPFREKIISKKITYQALIKMLDGEWDSIDSNDITDL